MENYPLKTLPLEKVFETIATIREEHYSEFSDDFQNGFKKCYAFFQIGLHKDKITDTLRELHKKVKEQKKNINQLAENLKEEKINKPVEEKEKNPEFIKLQNIILKLNKQIEQQMYDAARLLKENALLKEELNFPSSQITKLTEENEKLKKQIAHLETTITILKKQANSLPSQITKPVTENEKLQKQIIHLEHTIKQQQIKNMELKAMLKNQ